MKRPWEENTLRCFSLGGMSQILRGIQQRNIPFPLRKTTASSVTLWAWWCTIWSVPPVCREKMPPRYAPSSHIPSLTSASTPGVVTPFPTMSIPCSRKLWGRKLLQMSKFCGYSQMFLQEIWGVTFFGGTNKQSAKVFFMKIVFSTKSQKFSPSKVSHYMVWCHYNDVNIA